METWKKEDIEVRDVTEEWNARWMKKKKYKEVLLQVRVEAVDARAVTLIFEGIDGKVRCCRKTLSARIGDFDRLDKIENEVFKKK